MKNLIDQYPFNSKLMKVNKTQYETLIKEWEDDLNDSRTEEDIAYHNEFYLKAIFRKKYLSFM